MLPIRARFAARRSVSPRYYRRVSRVVAHPLRFYGLLMLKLCPGLHQRPVALRLKDGKTIYIREFWTLYLFDEIFMNNCYEPPAVTQGAPFDVVIDIGANIGLFTLRSKQLWPDATVIAVEPHPTNFRHLQEHIAVNGLTDVHARQIGIADQCGCFDLYLSPRNIGGHSMYKMDDTFDSIPVSTTTLVELLAETNVEGKRVLLKIDCEGCEFPLLTTLTQEMADNISCIIFEPELHLYDIEPVLRKLEGLGYAVSPSSNLMVAVRT